MKILALVFVGLVSVLSAQAAPITGKDLVGGYLVARSSSGDSLTVEMQVKAIGEDLLITSYRAGTLDGAAPVVLKGNLTLKGADQAVIDVVGDGAEYVAYVKFAGAQSKDLAKGVAIQISVDGQQWLPYSLRKQDKPYFAN